MNTKSIWLYAAILTAPINANAQFERTVIVEEFTGEGCVNCPRVAGWMHDVLGSDEVYQKRVAAVCHHSGFRDDWLTQPCDKAMVWLYNGSSFAPAVMYDRRPYFVSNGDQPSATHCPSSQDELQAYIDQELTVEAQVGLTLSLELDDDGSYVTVNVDGERTSLYTDGNPCITVYLMEDNIKAVNQRGGGTDFLHQHVIRDYNEDWGEPIEWEGDSFRYGYGFSIDGEWKREDLYVVAFVGNFDFSSVANCVIENAAKAYLWPQDITDDKPTVVSPATADNEIPPRFYRVDGTASKRLQRGIFFKKMSDGTCRKYMIP